MIISKELGDKLGIAGGLRGLAGLALDQGNFTSARALHEESMAMYQNAGYKRGIAASLISLAQVAIEQRDYTTARALLENSMIIARELVDKTVIVAKVVTIGIVDMLKGKYASARSFLEEGLALYRDLGDAGGIANSLCDLGNVAVLDSDHLAARALFQECLKMDWKLGNSRERIIGCLAGLGGASAGIGDGEKGAKLLGASDALRDAFGIHLWEDARSVRERSVTLACTLIGGNAFGRAYQEGLVMSMDQAIEYALQES